jgi:hypothetical protein
LSTTGASIFRVQDIYFTNHGMAHTGFFGMANQTDYYFKIAGSFIEKKIALDNVDLQILAMIEQNKSARQIIADLNISPAVLKPKLTALLKQKIIKVIENYDCLAREFADLVRKSLIEKVGPIGTMIFEDVLEALRLEEDNIPKIIAKDFILMVAREIPDEDQSREFTDRMFNQLAKSSA